MKSFSRQTQCRVWSTAAAAAAAAAEFSLGWTLNYPLGAAAGARGAS